MSPTRGIRKSVALRKKASQLSTMAALVAGIPALAGFLLLNGEGAGSNEGGGAGDAGAAAGNQGGAATQGAGTQGGGSQTGDAALGPAGEKALESFKERARLAEAENKAKDEKIAQLEQQNKSDSDKALDAARAEGKKVAEAELGPANERLTIEVAILRSVGSKFADMDDAVLNLADKKDEFLDNGKVDVEKLTKTADALLEKKPHLAAGQAAAGTGGNGQSNGAARPKQGAGSESASGATGGAGKDLDLLKRMSDAVKQRTGIT